MNFDATFLFTMPTKIYWGYNCVNLAGEEGKKLGMGKALVVTDKGVHTAGIVTPLLKSLESAGLSYEIFEEVPEDPDTQVVDRGAAFLKQTGCSGVVVIGGGSPLCAGKGIALVVTNGGNVRDYEGLERFQRPPLPVLAIPTTAGSGSEVSSVFIISDEKRNNYKMTIGGYRCHPEVAILDPILLRSLPARQFIASGVDALVHAIEATCTNQATPLTDAIAYEAIRLIMNNIASAALTDDLDAKGRQLLASAMANIACGNAKLGLVHAMSQPLGSYHLAHGWANGILLPYVMEYNLPACEEKFAKMAEAVGIANPQMTPAEKAGAVLRSVRNLLKNLDFPDRIPEDIAPKAAIAQMAKTAMGRPQVKSNARKAQENDLVEIYKRAYLGWC